MSVTISLRPTALRGSTPSVALVNLEDLRDASASLSFGKTRQRTRRAHDAGGFHSHLQILDAVILLYWR